MITLLTKDEARELTEPFHEAWTNAHTDAWALWQKQLTDNPEFVKPFTSSDRYLILHRHITDNAARALDEQVVSTDKLGFFAQLVDSRALVRFKHLDSNLKPKNHASDQQDHLGKQQYTEKMVEQLALGDVATLPTVLTVGYTLTPGEDELSRVVLICRSPKLLYCIDLLDEGAADVAVDTFPTMEPPAPRIISTRPKQDEAPGDEE